MSAPGASGTLNPCCDGVPSRRCFEHREDDDDVDDCGEFAHLTGRDDQTDELDRGRGRLATEQLLDDLLATLRRDRRVGQRGTQLIVGFERGARPVSRSPGTPNCNGRLVSG